MEKRIKQYTMIGWREWISLPELGIPSIKAKIDSGARTSSLHAFKIERFHHSGKDKVRFEVHPKQRNDNTIVSCVADLVDFRWVMDSGGGREHRCVIETKIIMGSIEKLIEITLTNRSMMTFRMLLGRSALQEHFTINPSFSYLLKKRTPGNLT